MAYDPITDFPALSRATGGGGVRFERMPGLDFVIQALARARLVTIYTGQTAPMVNKPTTAWFLPASPSWSAEGALFLWDAANAQYAPATPALWTALLAVTFITNGYSFQSAPDPANQVLVGTSVLAVQRDNGGIAAATSVVLPNLLGQWAATSQKLQVVDFSTNILNHDITVSTPDGSTIMNRVNLQLFSTPDQLAGASFQPVPELNSWIVTP